MRYITETADLNRRSPMAKSERQAEVSQRFHHIGDVVTLTSLSANALRTWERAMLTTSAARGAKSLWPWTR